MTHALLSFLIVFGGFTATGSLLLLPAWLYNRLRKRTDSRFFPFFHAPAIAVQYVLFQTGVGDVPSLGNLTEFMQLVAAAVTAGYVKVLLIDLVVKRPKLSTYTIAVLLVLGATLLRLLMPTQPQ